jgi:hypothetical protein
MYPPALAVPDTDLAALLTETGVISLVDIDGGTSRWDAAVAAGARQRWCAASQNGVGDGQLIGLDLGAGAESARCQHTTAYSCATPVAAGVGIVLADQTGSSRGISVD